jgi:hypothetical protein
VHSYQHYLCTSDKLCIISLNRRYIQNFIPLLCAGGSSRASEELLGLRHASPRRVVSELNTDLLHEYFAALTPLLAHYDHYAGVQVCPRRCAVQCLHD